MMLAACDDDDGAGNGGGILRFCLLATDMAGRERARGRVCGTCGRGLATAKISTSVCTFL